MMRRLVLLLPALIPALPAGPGPSQPIFGEDFAGPDVPTSWTVDTSSGSTIDISNGRLHISGPLNAFAHIEHPLDQDSVTATVLLQAGVPSGVTWCAGIFLYWAPGAWCQLGIIDPQDGRYYTAEAAGGTVAEHYLAPCDRTVPHWLRIELGRDCVRFLTRNPGEGEWTRQRTAARPPEWSGPPKLLVLGKGHSAENASAYAKPDLDNDYADLGPPCEAWFDELRVEETPRGRLALDPSELLPAGDTQGETILAEPGDPTYEQVAAIYPAMVHAREAIGVKGHPDEIGITETGSVELGSVPIGGESQPAIGTITVGDDYTPLGSGPTKPVKRLLDGYIPVVVSTWSHDGVDYEQTVTGYSDELSDAAPLRAYVHLRATCPAGERQVRVGFRVSPSAAGVLSAEQVITIPEGGFQTWAVRVPYAPTFGSMVEDICPCEAEAAKYATRRFWRHELQKGMQIQIPDQRLQDAQRAWLAYNAIDVDRVGDLYEPHDGSGFYEQVYGYSAARYAWVLDLWGRHDDAEAALTALIAHQTPEGLLDWNFGLTDTGALLVAMAVHYETTRDADWLRANAGAATKACEWLRDARAAAQDLDLPLRGLVKHRSYCDYAEPVYSYLHNAYCAAGMERIAPALRAVGLKQEARRIAREGAAYRRDVLTSMRASTVEVLGRPVIPLEPDTHRLLRDSSYESRNYYTLVASTMLECGIPGPRSREAKRIASFLREAGGIRMGVCEFAGGIDHAYAYGYLEHRLVHDDAERYLLGLYTSLAYGMTRETYSSVECTQHTTGENAPTLPHLYSGTQQLFMLRTLLIREEGGRLILGSGVPRTWLEDGKVTGFTDAPTRWGPVGLRIDSRVAAGEIRADLTGPPRGEVEVVLHFRHPSERPISSVTVDGRTCKSFDAETVTFPLDADGALVSVRYD